MTWEVCSYRYNGQINGPENITDFFEDLAIGSVSRIAYFLAFGRLYNKTTPQSSISLMDFSFGPMANWEKCDLQLNIIYTNLFSLGPVHFD